MNDTKTINKTTKKPLNWLKIGIVSAFATIGLFLAHYDLDVSSRYYNGKFYLRDTLLVKIVHSGVALLVSSLWLWSVWQYRRGKKGLSSLINGQQLKFLNITLFGWSIALVHLIKTSFGRIRPSLASAFGGDFDFTPAFTFSNQCRADCSFVSGHTGVMVWLIAFALVLPKKWRPLAFATSAICIIFTAWARIMGGFHFLSDIYFSIFFVGLGIEHARHRYLHS